MHVYKQEISISLFDIYNHFLRATIPGSHFYIDSRSIALFRVLISLVIIHDLGVRLSDFTAHYTEQGVLPMHAWQQYFAAPGFWTALGTNSVYTLLLFGAGILAAVFMMLGSYVRIMAIVCWLVLMSAQNRNPILYQGGDDMLRMVLFWFIWLPKYNSPAGVAYKISGWATMALLLQALFPFFFTGMAKGIYEWWYDGTAFYYALQLDQLTRSFGLWLAGFPAITIVLTRMVYIAELLVLPLFLLPFYKERTRAAVAIILVVFSTGSMLCFMIGVFPLCILACSVLFIPTSLWQKMRPVASVTDYLDVQQLIVAWGKQFALLFMFVLVLWWNLADMGGSRLIFPQSLRPFMYSLRLNQSWGMFAPGVIKEDGWLVIAATLNSGSVIDLNNDNRPPVFDKPVYVLDRFKNDRWRKYTEQLFVNTNSHIRPYYADCLMRTYNSKHSPDPIKHLAIYYMLERTPQDGSQPVIEKVLLYETMVHK